MSLPGRTAAALLAAASLTGCETMVTTVTSYDVAFPTGVPSEFSYAAVGGDMPVVVVGNPFPLPKKDVDDAVIAAMQGKTFGARVRFVPAEGDSLATGYAVVMLLDGIGGASGNTACAWRSQLAFSSEAAPPRGAPAPSSPSQATPSQTTAPASAAAAPAPLPPALPSTLLAAFCGNADARSWAFSTTGPIESPYSDHFRDLVARTTMSMLPPRDDDYHNSNDFD